MADGAASGLERSVTYERLANLPLTIDSSARERQELAVSGGFARATTVVRLRGLGEEGVGEDVTYDAAEHDAPPRPPVEGEWPTFDALSRHVGSLDLFGKSPAMGAYRNYRRWAYESAALDLALQQAGLSLAEAVGREPRPVSFVVSMRLGEPPTIRPLRRRLELYPWLRFKLDATSSWDDDLVAEIASLGVVASIDLKGAYSGTPVDQPPDPALYERIVRGFPNAWIEDPALTPETEPVLTEARDRITWDAPIHSVADIEALPFAPKTVNVKPSRFGSVAALFAAYDYCDARGLGAYGGGQFELGPGRGQIQYLASLFHPDMANDVAPAAYNEAEPVRGLPPSPLEPRVDPIGFRWAG